MSGQGIPPEILAAMSGQGGPGPGTPPGALPAGLPPEGVSAGGEAAAQSDVAAAGEAAWQRVQALQGARPEADDLKALLIYVLTEGPGAPDAPDITAYLQDKGIQVPGSNQNGGDDE